MDKVTTIAVDLGKRAFSVYWVEAHTGEIGARAMTRGKLEEFMRTRELARVVLEVGGSAHSKSIWLTGKVVKKRLVGAEALVDCEITATNQRGELVAISESTASSLPTQGR